MTVQCLKGCGREWLRDPILEVACPTCHARVGAKCKRPSGWTTWGPHDVHAERDLAADAAGAYGICPLGRCGVANKPAAPQQMDLL